MDIEYSQYRKRVFKAGIIFIFTVCVLELAYFFGYYYSQLEVDNLTKYLIKNIITPTVVDTIVYIACWQIAKRAKNEKVKNVASIVMMAVPAALVTIVHYAFPQLGLIMAIPMILCSSYGYNRVGIVLLLSGIGAMLIAYIWCLYQSDMTLVMASMMYIISVVLYCCVYTAFVIVTKNTKEKINKLVEYRNKQDEFVERLKYDSLTNLYNNNAIKTIVHMRLEDNINFNGALAMIDIDDFKHCNDTYGHVFGDKVLTSLAKAIKSRCNENVIGARYGGEEFIILFINKSRDEIVDFLNEIRTEFKEAFKERELTFSTGVAINKGKFNSELEFIDTADKLLYKVKNDNKDDILLD